MRQAGDDINAALKTVGQGAFIPAEESPRAQDQGLGGPLLEIRNLSVRFGGITALSGVSFNIESGSVVGLIGPNGAGKTTLFNCLSRLYSPTEGEILLKGGSILQCEPHDMAGLGIGRTFQNLALFETMTVFDNVMVGRHCTGRSSVSLDMLRLPGVVAAERGHAEKALELLDRLSLTGMADQKVADLTFATKKRVEFARAMAAEPSLLLLDEPAGGLNHEEVGELADLIRSVRDDHQITVLLVEHHMNLVMEVSDQVVALDFGKKIADGAPKVVQSDPRVIGAYLGEEVDA